MYGRSVAQLVQLLLEVVADLLGVARQVLLDRLAHHRQRHRRRQRVAAERRAVVAVGEDVRLLGAEDRADRHAAAEPLRQRHHVRLDAVQLVAPQRPEPPDARLDLVEDQQQVVLVAPVAQALEVLLRGRVDAALALDRLDHHRAGLVGGRLLDRLKVVERDRVGQEAVRQRAVILLVGRLAGRGQHRQRAAVERVVGRDDLVGAVPLVLAVLARQLHRALVRLDAAVREEDPVEDRVLDQQVGQLELRHGVELVRRVDQLRRLLGQRVHDHRRAVAQRVDGPAADHVQVRLPLLVPDPAALAAHQHDRRPLGDRHVPL